MIYYFLYLKVQFCSEVIERVLRVVRHRGFVLHTLHVIPSDRGIITNGCELYVHMTLMGNRSINILYENLNKLVDVSYIVIQNGNSNDIKQ